MRYPFSFLWIICVGAMFLCGQTTPEHPHALLKPSLFQMAALADSDSTPSESLPVVQGSRARAFWLSFLIPGAGELYLGDKKMAVIFFSAEIALWSTYFLLRSYGDLKADDYMLYATSHAGISAKGKDHDFFVNIEDYESLIAYNDAMLQERRPEDMYPEDGYYHWSWDSQNSMNQFERMRMKSDRAKNAGLFVIGGVVLNHLVSGVDAIRIARKSSASAQNNIHLQFVGLPEGGMRMTLWKRF